MLYTMDLPHVLQSTWIKKKSCLSKNDIWMFEKTLLAKVYQQAFFTNDWLWQTVVDLSYFTIMSLVISLHHN